MTTRSKKDGGARTPMMIRMNAQERRELQEMADEDHRSVSDLVRHLAREERKRRARRKD